MEASKRMKAIVGVALMPFLIATLAQATTVSARVPADHLVQVGPVSGENGFPVWYRDSSQPGTRVEACIDDTDPMCGFLPGDVPDAARPISFPDNFPQEVFYQRATALATMPVANGGGKVTLDLALEGAFATGPVIAGDQMVFARVRIKITNVPAGTTYTVTHPYGVERVTASDKGVIFVTDDVGLTPGEFTGALKGRHSPFLRWDTGAPAGYLGDPAVEHAIVGSPYTDAAGLPQNYLSIRDSLGLEVARSNVFAVSGKLATNAGLDVQAVTYSPSGSADAGVLDVYATSEVGQAIQVATDPAAGITNTTLVGDGSRYYGRIAYAHKPTNLTIINASDTPAASKTIILTDVIAVTRTSFDGATLSVSASSSDPSAVLTVAGFGALVAGSADFVGLGAVPPTITVTSDRGGTASQNVTSAGSTLDPTPVIAFAGPDQSVQQASAVTLDGTATNGEIAAFRWAQAPVAGEPVVVLVAADTAKATFTAPSVETTLHFTLTTTGVSGEVSSSSSTVTVLPLPVAPPVANAGPAQTVARGTKVTLAGSATDASSFVWTQTAGDPVGAIASVAQPTFTYPLFNASRGSTNTPLDFTLTVTGPTGSSTATVRITPSVDTTNVTARFRQRGQWLISGTAAPFAAGQTITIHAGPTLAGPVLGTAVVSTADGTWSWKKDVAARATAPNSTVSIESSLGFTRLAIPVAVTS